MKYKDDFEVLYCKTCLKSFFATRMKKEFYKFENDFFDKTNCLLKYIKILNKELPIEIKVIKPKTLEIIKLTVEKKENNGRN